MCKIYIESASKDIKNCFPLMKNRGPGVKNRHLPPRRISVFLPVRRFFPFCKGQQRGVRRYPFRRNGPPGGVFGEFLIDETVVESGVFRVPAGRGEIQPCEPRPVNRAEAHRAGFAGSVDFTALQAVSPELFACGADGVHFRVGGRVEVARHGIGTFGDDPPVFDDDGPEGTAAGLCALRRYGYGAFYELLVHYAVKISKKARRGILKMKKPSVRGRLGKTSMISVDQTFASFLSAAALSVRSQVKRLPVRPKCPSAAVSS